MTLCNLAEDEDYCPEKIVSFQCCDPCNPEFACENTTASYEIGFESEADITEQCTEELLWELFLQAGPIANVHIPKDKVTNIHQGFGFVEFKTEEDSDYAIKVMQMIKLHGQPLRLNKKNSGEIREAEIGANLFLGNLDPEVDEKLLYDTFSAFGVIIGNTPKCMRDPETGNSRGFGFVSFETFEIGRASCRERV